MISGMNRELVTRHLFSELIVHLFIQCSRSKADKRISLYDPLHNVEQFNFKLTWHSVLTWQM